VAEKSADTSTAETDVSEDVLFSVLAARRRRELLRFVADAGGEVPLSMVTEHIARAEGASDPPPENRLKAVYVSLYQTHVPQLVTAGVVEYDPDEKVVRLTDRAKPVLAHLYFDPEATTRGLFSKLFGGPRRRSA
jgi:hypothetical protein